MTACQNVASIIAKNNLKAGQPMKDETGKDMENSRVIHDHGYIMSDKDTGHFSIVLTNRETGQDEINHFNMEIARHIASFMMMSTYNIINAGEKIADDIQNNARTYGNMESLAMVEKIIAAIPMTITSEKLYENFMEWGREYGLHSTVMTYLEESKSLNGATPREWLEFSQMLKMFERDSISITEKREILSMVMDNKNTVDAYFRWMNKTMDEDQG